MYRYTAPKQKRKDMKYNKRDSGGGEVTYALTHLPLVIRDLTAKDLRRPPEDEPTPEVRKMGTGVTDCQFTLEQREFQEIYDGMLNMSDLFIKLHASGLRYRLCNRII